MNRREFLKRGIAGLFGTALAWAGVVKAEEPEPKTFNVHFTEDIEAWRYCSGPFNDEEKPLAFVNLDVPYEWFFAKYDAARVAAVTVDGEDVSALCTTFYGPCKPGVLGWGMAVLLDQFIPDDDGGHWKTKGITGDIRWEEAEPETILDYPVVPVSEELLIDGEFDIEWGPLPDPVDWDAAPKEWHGTVRFEWTD